MDRFWIADELGHCTKCTSMQSCSKSCSFSLLWVTYLHKYSSAQVKMKMMLCSLRSAGWQESNEEALMQDVRSCISALSDPELSIKLCTLTQEHTNLHHTITLLDKNLIFTKIRWQLSGHDTVMWLSMALKEDTCHWLQFAFDKLICRNEKKTG